MSYDEKCPVCGGETESMCRCSSRVLPHTLEQVQKGHGHACANGHRWSGDIVVDAETGAVIESRSKPMKTSELLEKAKGDVKGGKFWAIAQLTAQNDHNRALIQAASRIGAKHFEKIADHIAALHDLEGDMPNGLYEYRNDVRKRLIEFAKKKLSGDDFRDFKAAF